MDGQIAPKLITKAISSGKRQGNLGTSSHLQQALLELESSNMLGNQNAQDKWSNVLPLGSSSNRVSRVRWDIAEGAVTLSWRPGWVMNVCSTRWVTTLRTTCCHMWPGLPTPLDGRRWKFQISRCLGSVMSNQKQWKEWGCGIPLMNITLAPRDERAGKGEGRSKFHLTSYWKHTPTHTHQLMEPALLGLLRIGSVFPYNFLS